MSINASTTSAEKPLQGAILCCTSIVPEERTRLAEYAQQMGADHKLDLTSDVTHLLVGDTNSAKYQYVAREREDVKVLRPEWVEAVRECWMQDRPLDLNALDARYRLPTLAGLKICITGFDDLSFRAQLQHNVIYNGGEYTGDLTKDVTHLIAAAPVGKKYEYASMWQKKIVALKWYKDTLERGMQLDESLYHPSTPVDEQGIGAWNRAPKGQAVGGKRTRDDAAAQEPPRKLRRTASAKLGSQSDNMWNTIVAAQSYEDIPTGRDKLRPSTSMPVLNGHGKQSAQPGSRKSDTNASERLAANAGSGFLDGWHFNVHGFDAKRQVLIQKTLVGHGGTVHDTLDRSLHCEGVGEGRLCLLVPHQFRRHNLPMLAQTSDNLTVISELWLEWCMTRTAAVPVKEYPLGGLFETSHHTRPPSMKLNATGFPGIQTLHISKVVVSSGAVYEEVFSADTSVLVCNSNNLNVQKLIHADKWNVPAVSEQWLWKFLSSGATPPFESYLIQHRGSSRPDREAQLNGAASAERPNPGSEVKVGGGYKIPDAAVVPLPPARMTESVANEQTTSKEPSRRENTRLQNQRQDNHGSKTPRVYEGRPSLSPALNRDTGANGTALVPLREISTNSPTRKPTPEAAQPKKKLFQSREGLTHTRQEDTDNQLEQKITSIGEGVANRHGTDGNEAVNSTIAELLLLKAQGKSNKADTTQQGGNNKNRLLERALSNVSNSSRTSNQLNNGHSRASSIDSINTDGLGTELSLNPTRSGNKTEDQSTPKTSFGGLTGRAKAHALTAATMVADACQDGHKLHAIELGDPGLCRDDFAEEDLGPDRTQLGYEDSEEAIALREKLAEKRRARGRLGQIADDPKPELSRKEREQRRQKRVIRDDEAVVGVGWAGGRRTRQRDRLSEVDMEFA